MDIVYIKQLQADAVIGVYDWEREITQRLVFDLEIGCDTRAAAASDDLADALDYHAISMRLIEYTKASSFQLIEALGERLAEIVLNEFGAAWVKLTIDKPGAVPEAAGVGIIIERGSR